MPCARTNRLSLENPCSRVWYTIATRGSRRIRSSFPAERERCRVTDYTVLATYQSAGRDAGDDGTARSRDICGGRSKVADHHGVHFWAFGRLSTPASGFSSTLSRFTGAHDRKPQATIAAHQEACGVSRHIFTRALLPGSRTTRGYVAQHAGTAVGAVRLGHRDKEIEGVLCSALLQRKHELLLAECIPQLLAEAIEKGPQDRPDGHPQRCSRGLGRDMEFRRLGDIS